MDLNRKNNDLKNLILFSNNALHNSFHRKIYDYFLETYGRKEIDKYLKWFMKTVGEDDYVLVPRSV